MNQSLKSYFLLAKSNLDKQEYISRDFGYFLKSLEISDAIIAIEDDFDLSIEQISKIDLFFSSYLDGVPLEYILGESSFFGYKFYVDSRVLIPRPETELIVEWVLDLSLQKNSSIAEVGTGSGCIALSIALQKTNFKIMATDLSDLALEVAYINKKYHDVKNLLLVQSDWMSCVQENSLDLIISNPPYLKPNDSHLKNLRHEPLMALTSKNGSQSFYGIASQAILSLKSGGKIIFEHGCSQTREVSSILENFGFKNVITEQDFQGLDRYTHAEKL